MLCKRTVLRKQKLLTQAGQALEAKNTENPRTPKKAPKPIRLQDGGNSGK
jgi:hypothetical protein